MSKNSKNHIYKRKKYNKEETLENEEPTIYNDLQKDNRLFPSLHHSIVSDLFADAHNNAQTLSIGDYEGGSLSRTKNLMHIIDEEYERPAPVFVEILNYTQPTDITWTEVARYIKFRELTLESGHRWSKPHVPRTNLMSLLQARNCLLRGTVILDFEALDFTNIADQILLSWEANQALSHSNFTSVRKALLLKKCHIQTKNISGEILERVRVNRGHRIDSENDLEEISWTHQPQQMNVMEQLMAHVHSAAVLPAEVSTEESISTGERSIKSLHITGNIQKAKKKLSGNAASTRNKEKDLLVLAAEGLLNKVHKPKKGFDATQEHLRRKVAEEAEGGAILCCRLEKLKKAAFAFVRLKPPKPDLGDLLEITELPVRFIIVIASPIANNPSGAFDDNNDIANAMGLLMSDEIFCTIAYAAKDNVEMVNAIDEVIRHCIIIPPGKLDLKENIDPPDHKPSQIDRLNIKRHGVDSNFTNNFNENLIEDEDHHNPIIHESLRRSAKWFGGLVRDVKRKLPYYASDYVDGMRLINLPQILGSIIFLYVVQMTNLVTYGQLLRVSLSYGGEDNAPMAVFEAVLAGGICGIIFAIFAGQPLSIISETGHVLVFEQILSSYCHARGFDFLAVRFWSGMWAAGIFLFIVASDNSALLAFVTRFSEEIFASLIGIFFILEALEAMVDIKMEEEYEPYSGKELTSHMGLDPCRCNATDEQVTLIYPQFVGQTFDEFNETCWQKYGESVEGQFCDNYEPSGYMFAVLLFIGTFLIVIFLKWFRNTRFFTSFIRNSLANFSIFIAIIIMTVVSISLSYVTPAVNVPRRFHPSSPHGSWIVNPFPSNGINVGVIIFALFPAILLSILMILDQHITAVIVNNPDNKLKKGLGYHLDLAVICVTTILCAILGLPFLVADTVISISHLQSLRIESETHAPGEVPVFLGIREQRISNLISSLFLFGSLFLGKWIDNIIPEPVVYGVFFFMGLSSLDQQLIDRVMLFFIPMKHQPDYVYLRIVPLLRVHLFTLVQLICFAILFVIKLMPKTKPFFPLFLIALILTRKLLEKVFTEKELEALDHRLPHWHEINEPDRPKPFIYRLYLRIKYKYLGGDSNRQPTPVPTPPPSLRVTRLQYSSKKMNDSSDSDNGQSTQIETRTNEENIDATPEILVHPSTRTPSTLTNKSQDPIHEHVAVNDEIEECTLSSRRVPLKHQQTVDSNSITQAESSLKDEDSRKG